MGIFEVHEVSIESSSPRTPGIRAPQNLQELKKKSAPIRQGHQEAEPFKRRRSRVNGRTSEHRSGLKPVRETRMGG